MLEQFNQSKNTLQNQSQTTGPPPNNKLAMDTKVLKISSPLLLCLSPKALIKAKTKAKLAKKDRNSKSNKSFTQITKSS